jgi:tetratricopeptide (TPR) repeat protein
MGRLLDIGLVNDLWNRGWTAFTEKKYAEARTIQERTATMAEKQPAVLPEVLYDLAVIRLAAGDPDGARKALDRALALNPKLKAQAEKDPDLEKLR